MNPQTRKTAWWSGLVLIVALAACESPSAVETSTDDATTTAALDLSNTLAEELSLSASQAASVQQSITGHADERGDPGFLWYAAADLQQTLTDEQKATLFERTSQMGMAPFTGVCAFPMHRVGLPGGRPGFGRPGERPGFGRPGERPSFGRPGERPSFGRPGFGDGTRPFSPFADLLTEEQQAAVEEIFTRYKPQVEALITAHRNGELTDEAFRTQMQALQEALRAEIDALLTDEQKAALEARRAEREAQITDYLGAVKAAMADALDLTAEQQASIEALCTAQQTAREELFESFQAGSLTAAELQTSLQALHAEETTTLQGLLNEQQYEIVEIHGALQARHFRFGAGGPGGGRFGGRPVSG